MNRYKIYGIIFATVSGIAMIAILLGTWAKITHKPFADKVFMIGLCLGGIAFVALAVILAIYLFRKYSKDP